MEEPALIMGALSNLQIKNIVEVRRAVQLGCWYHTCAHATYRDGPAWQAAFLQATATTPHATYTHVHAMAYDPHYSHTLMLSFPDICRRARV